MTKTECDGVRASGQIFNFQNNSFYRFMAHNFPR